MRLLISVATPEEAEAAVAGGANLIDAKNPVAGALGAVSLEMLRRIHASVDRQRPITAALGDASDEAAIERMAHDYASLGTTFVKVGFAAIESAERVAQLIKAASQGAGTTGRCGVVAVAYADAGYARSLDMDALLDVAAQAGASGVLLDTADKTGPGLRDLVTPQQLKAWVESAHEAGLVVALAGRLTAGDLTLVRDSGADIAGFRGAACDGDRLTQVSIERVRDLYDAARATERMLHLGQRPHLVG